MASVTPFDLQIRLLGDFRVMSGGKALTGLNAPRLQSLLAYLLLHRGAPQHRQHLAFLFWPDSTEAQARTNLRKVLLLLRQALPDADRYLVLEGQSVCWSADAPIALDVADFERELASARRAPDEQAELASLERAASRYGGALLPGCYDDWVQPERERLAASHAAILARLRRILEARREYETAARYARTTLTEDPLNELAYRDLMRLLALSGNRAAALHVYHTCVTTLRRELDVEPDEETRELYEGLMRDPDAARVPVAARGALPLVGRSAEWAQLQEAWRTAAGGSARLVLLAGEAGIGKTRLADELYDWVVRLGGFAARARCGPADTRVAYAPIAAWLKSDAIRRSLSTLDDVWLGELARLLPELLAARPAIPQPRPMTEGWQRRGFFEALARGVRASSGPLLLLLDDLHWCDPDTLDWLGYLLQSEFGSRLCLVGTIRTEEAPGLHYLSSLRDVAARDSRLLFIELGPLTSAETAAVADHAAGYALPAAQAQQLYALSEGNPLFVIEAVRSLLESERTGQRAAGDDVPALSSATIQAVIARRLSLLSSPARELAGLASVFGRSFAFTDLQAAAHADEEVLLAAIDELWQRRIIRERAAGERTDDYEFTHDRIREAAYAGLGAARRQVLHRKAADALVASHSSSPDAVAARIATHYEQAGCNAQAVSYYRRAAETAERLYAHHDAASHLRRGLALLAEHDPTAARLWERLGDVLHFTAQYADAEAAYRRGLEPAAEWSERARLRRKIGNSLRDRREYPEADEAYRAAGRALEQAGPPEPGDPALEGWWQEWIQVRFEQVQLEYWLGRPDASLDLLLAMREQVEAHGLTAQRAHFRMQLLGMSLRRQRFAPSAETEGYLAAAETIAIELDQEPAQAALLFQLGFYSLWHGTLNRAEPLMLAGLRLAEHTGDASLRARCLTYLAVLYRRLGAEAEVQRYAALALEAAAAAGMPEYVATARANQAWLAWRRGDVARAEANGLAALELWRQLPAGHGSAVFQWTALWPLAGSALRAGDVARAVEYARALLEPPQQRLPDELAAPLEEAIHAYERNDPFEARQFMARAAASAIASNLF
jgi:DNA-binding SARP family transcriptional activator